MDAVNLQTFLKQFKDLLIQPVHSLPFRIPFYNNVMLHLLLSPLSHLIILSIR